MKISTNTIERLLVYRKILKSLISESVTNIYSYRLAHLAENTPAQVRRDLMVIGYTGSPAHGYNTSELEKAISSFLDDPETENVAIFGIGKLGRAILDYCKQRNDKINIVAAFDIDQQKINRMINGCYCYHINELETIVREKKIEVAILTIPSAEEAQNAAERLAAAGIRGLLNYTAAQLKLSPDIYIENRDMMIALEKVVYFSRNK
jgi:redox-sensing transcriptional repressor